MKVWSATQINQWMRQTAKSITAEVPPPQHNRREAAIEASIEWWGDNFGGEPADGPKWPGTKQSIDMISQAHQVFLAALQVGYVWEGDYGAHPDMTTLQNLLADALDVHTGLLVSSLPGSPKNWSPRESRG